MKAKTISFHEVSTIRMVQGGEKKHPTIIHAGRVKDWVGIGWIDLRPATKADRRKYPEVK